MAEILVFDTKLVVAEETDGDHQVECIVTPNNDAELRINGDHDSGWESAHFDRETLREFCRATLSALDATE